MKIKCTVELTEDDNFIVEDGDGWHWAVIHPFYTNLSNPDADELAPGDKIEVDHFNLLKVPEEYDEPLEPYLEPFEKIAAYRASMTLVHVVVTEITEDSVIVTDEQGKRWDLRDEKDDVDPVGTNLLVDRRFLY